MLDEKCMKRRTALKTSLMIVLFIGSVVQVTGLKGTEPFFTLKFGVGYYSDYALQVKDYLADINIEVEIGDEMWAGFLPPNLMDYRDWDMVTLFKGDMNSIDLRKYFSSNGTYNIFGLNPGIPYQNQSDFMQEMILPYLPLSSEKYSNFNLLQEAIMELIVPLLPMFNPRNYLSLWSNVYGYRSNWGLSDSLPYMEYTSLHEGQVSLDEFRMADSNWKELNQIYSDDKASELIIQFISEPIIQINPDNKVKMKTGIIEDWEFISTYHTKYYLRDIYWNPSFNITDRDENSDPLNSSNTNQLMTGLKGEYSNGTNQRVTAKDVVFTLLAKANQITSDSANEYDWLADCFVDANNSNSFHIIQKHYDGQYIFDFLLVDIARYLNDIELLPEFFLNSTESTVSHTEGGIECTGLYPEIANTPQWSTFSKSAFGCGKFMLDYSKKNSITVLRKSPYWFGVGAIFGNSGLEPFVDTIVIEVIPDYVAEFAKFVHGELDMYDGPIFYSEMREMVDNPDYLVHSYISPRMDFIAFNLNRPNIGGEDNQAWLNLTDDYMYTKALTVRKAICHAIDREEINQIEYGGEYNIVHRPSTCWLPEWFNDIRVKYDYNLEKAWELMENAGYEKPLPFITDNPLTISVVIFALVVLIRIKKRINKK